MNRISSLTAFWHNIRETDLRPIREQALRGIHITIVSVEKTQSDFLAHKLRSDLIHPQLSTDTPVQLLGLENSDQAAKADLIILLVDNLSKNFKHYQKWVSYWQEAELNLIVIFNLSDEGGSSQAVSPWANTDRRRTLIGSIHDPLFLSEKFAPAVVEMVPSYLLALGRYFPLFRLAVAQYLINDTSFSNAAYAMSTGIAEIVPILNFPLTIADTIVLTKAQAFLVYKLGLAFGYSTRWQDYVGEFGSVISSGFIWRQLARMLIGLIPIFGILPKTAIAYTGTYVIGKATLQWYLTGRHITKNQMRLLYRQTSERGRILARNLASLIPRPRIRKLRLFPGRIASPKLDKVSTATKPKRFPSPKKRKGTCPHCTRTNARDAQFCQYCGKPIGKPD